MLVIHPLNIPKPPLPNLLAKHAVTIQCALSKMPLGSIHSLLQLLRCYSREWQIVAPEFYFPTHLQLSTPKPHAHSQLVRSAPGLQWCRVNMRFPVSHSKPLLPTPVCLLASRHPAHHKCLPRSLLRLLNLVLLLLPGPK